MDGMEERRWKARTLHDGSVRAELALSGTAEDAHLTPLRLVAEGLVDEGLGLEVRPEVVRHTPEKTKATGRQHERGPVRRQRDATDQWSPFCETLSTRGAKISQGPNVPCLMLSKTAARGGHFCSTGTGEVLFLYWSPAIWDD